MKAEFTLNTGRIQYERIKQNFRELASKYHVSVEFPIQFIIGQREFKITLDGSEKNIRDLMGRWQEIKRLIY